MPTDPFADINFKTEFSKSRYTEIIIARNKKIAKFCDSTISVADAYETLTKHSYKACEARMIAGPQQQVQLGYVSNYNKGSYTPFEEFSNSNDSDFRIQNYIAPQGETEAQYWSRVSAPLGLSWLSAYSGAASTVSKPPFSFNFKDPGIYGFWSSLNKQFPDVDKIAFGMVKDIDNTSPYDVLSCMIGSIQPEIEPANTLTYDNVRLHGNYADTLGGRAIFRIASDKFSSHNTFQVNGDYIKGSDQITTENLDAYAVDLFGNTRQFPDGEFTINLFVDKVNHSYVYGAWNITITRKTSTTFRISISADRYNSSVTGSLYRGTAKYFSADFSWPQDVGYVLLTIVYKRITKDYNVFSHIYSITSDLKLYVNAKQILATLDLADPSVNRKQLDRGRKPWPGDLDVDFGISESTFALISITDGIMSDFNIYRLYTHCIRYQRDLPNFTEITGKSPDPITPNPDPIPPPPKDPAPPTTDPIPIAQAGFKTAVELSNILLKSLNVDAGVDGTNFSMVLASTEALDVNGKLGVKASYKRSTPTVNKGLVPNPLDDTLTYVIVQTDPVNYHIEGSYRVLGSSSDFYTTGGTFGRFQLERSKTPDFEPPIVTKSKTSRSSGSRWIATGTFNIDGTLFTLPFIEPQPGLTTPVEVYLPPDQISVTNEPTQIDVYGTVLSGYNFGDQVSIITNESMEFQLTKTQVRWTPTVYEWWYEPIAGSYKTSSETKKTPFFAPAKFSWRDILYIAKSSEIALLFNRAFKLSTSFRPNEFLEFFSNTISSINQFATGYGSTFIGSTVPVIDIDLIGLNSDSEIVLTNILGYSAGGKVYTQLFYNSGDNTIIKITATQVGSSYEEVLVEVNLRGSATASWSSGAVTMSTDFLISQIVKYPGKNFLDTSFPFAFNNPQLKNEFICTGQPSNVKVNDITVKPADFKYISTYNINVGVPLTKLYIVQDVVLNVVCGNSIIKVNPDGTTSTFVSSGLNSPAGLAFDVDYNNLYVANYGDNNIIKIDKLGNSSIFATGLHGPRKIVVDYMTGFYVANHDNNTISYLSISGKLLKTFALPDAPVSILVSGDSLYVIYQDSDVVSRLNKNTGEFLYMPASYGDLKTPKDMSQGPAAPVYITSYNNSSVISISSTQDPKNSLVASQFMAPLNRQGYTGITLDIFGNIYVTDTLEGTIKKRDINTRAITTYASGLSNPTFIVGQRVDRQYDLTDIFPQQISPTLTGVTRTNIKAAFKTLYSNMYGDMYQVAPPWNDAWEANIAIYGEIDGDTYDPTFTLQKVDDVSVNTYDVQVRATYRGYSTYGGDLTVSPEIIYQYTYRFIQAGNANYYDAKGEIRGKAWLILTGPNPTDQGKITVDFTMPMAGSIECKGGLHRGGPPTISEGHFIISAPIKSTYLMMSGRFNGLDFQLESIKRYSKFIYHGKDIGLSWYKGYFDGTNTTKRVVVELDYPGSGVPTDNILKFDAKKKNEIEFVKQTNVNPYSDSNNPYAPFQYPQVPFNYKFDWPSSLYVQCDFFKIQDPDGVWHYLFKSYNFDIPGSDELSFRLASTGKLAPTDTYPSGVPFARYEFAQTLIAYVGGVFFSYVDTKQLGGFTIYYRVDRFNSRKFVIKTSPFKKPGGPSSHHASYWWLYGMQRVRYTRKDEGDLTKYDAPSEHTTSFLFVPDPLPGQDPYGNNWSPDRYLPVLANGVQSWKYGIGPVGQPLNDNTIAEYWELTIPQDKNYEMFNAYTWSESSRTYSIPVKIQVIMDPLSTEGVRYIPEYGLSLPIWDDYWGWPDISGSVTYGTLPGAKPKLTRKVLPPDTKFDAYIKWSQVGYAPDWTGKGAGTVPPDPKADPVPPPFVKPKALMPTFKLSKKIIMEVEGPQLIGKSYYPEMIIASQGTYPDKFRVQLDYVGLIDSASAYGYFSYKIASKQLTTGYATARHGFNIYPGPLSGSGGLVNGTQLKLLTTREPEEPPIPNCRRVSNGWTGEVLGPDGKVSVLEWIWFKPTSTPPDDYTWTALLPNPASGRLFDPNTSGEVTFQAIHVINDGIDRYRRTIDTLVSTGIVWMPDKYVFNANQDTYSRILDQGQTDYNWSLVSCPMSPIPKLYKPYNVWPVVKDSTHPESWRELGYAGGLQPAAWIAPAARIEQLTNAVGAGAYRYKTTFDLSGGGTYVNGKWTPDGTTDDLNSVVITFDVAVDNRIDEIYLNGQPILNGYILKLRKKASNNFTWPGYFDPSANDYANVYNVIIKSTLLASDGISDANLVNRFNGNFVAGVNTLEIAVTNITDSQQYNPTGIAVQIGYTVVYCQKSFTTTVYNNAKLIWEQETPITERLKFTSADSTIFIAEQQNTFSVKAGGSKPTISIVNGVLPLNVKLSSDGTLNGIPNLNTVGVWNLKLAATEGANYTTQDFKLTVAKSISITNPPSTIAPKITSPANVTFTIGVAKSFSVTASGSPTPKITITGVLPEGLIINPYNAIAGTALGPVGKAIISIVASNGVIPDDSQTLTITIVANTAPPISSPELAGNCKKVAAYTLSFASKNLKSLSFESQVYNVSTTKTDAKLGDIAPQPITQSYIKSFGYPISGAKWVKPEGVDPGFGCGLRYDCYEPDVWYPLSQMAKNTSQKRTFIIGTNSWITVRFRQSTALPGWLAEAKDIASVVLTQTTVGVNRTYTRVITDLQSILGKPSQRVLPPIFGVMAENGIKDLRTTLTISSGSALFERWIDDIVIEYGPGHCPKPNCLFTFLGTDLTTTFIGLTKTLDPATNKIDIRQYGTADLQFGSSYYLEAKKTTFVTFTPPVSLVRGQELVVTMSAYCVTKTTDVTLIIETLDSSGATVERFQDRLGVTHKDYFYYSNVFDNKSDSTDLMTKTTVTLDKPAQKVKLTITAGPSQVVMGFVNVCTDNVIIPPYKCSRNNVNNVTCRLVMEGVPRQEINLFYALCRYDVLTNTSTRANAFTTSTPILDGRNSTPLPSNCNASNLCNFWKQQGIAGQPATTVLSNKPVTSNGIEIDINKIKPADLNNLKAADNWVWASPLKSGDQPDEYIINFGDTANSFAEQNFVQEIDFLFAMNRVAVSSSDCSLTDPSSYPFVDTITLRAEDSSKFFSSIGITKDASGVNLDYSTATITFIRSRISKSGTITTATYTNNVTENGNEKSIVFGPSYKASGFVIEYNEVTDEFKIKPYKWEFGQSSIDYVFFKSSEFFTVGTKVSADSSDFNYEEVQIIPGGEQYTPSGPIVPINSWELAIEQSDTINLFAKGVENADSLSTRIAILSVNSSELKTGILQWGEPAGTVNSPSTSTCKDPAEEISVILEYINGSGVAKQFKNTINISDIPIVSETNSGFWSELKSNGNGLKSDFATWISSNFILDNTTGTGLDQCLEKSIIIGPPPPPPVDPPVDPPVPPGPPKVTGSGSSVFGVFKNTIKGRYTDKCETSVTITEIIAGLVQNEKQSIIVPDAISGYFTLSFKGQIAEIPFNANAEAIKANLAGLSTIGSTDNLDISGSGATSDPYIIEFKGSLGISEQPLLIPNYDFLLCRASGVSRVINTGSNAERQYITNFSGTRSPLTLSFNGFNSAAIPYNATLNEFKAAIVAITSIGDNVIVTGDVNDTNVAYQGPWFIDFVGSLAGQDMPVLTPLTAGYSQLTLWKGTAGVNSQQSVRIAGTIGAFQLTLFDSVNGIDFAATTGDIPYNATSAEVIEAITDSANFITGTDLIVTQFRDLNNFDINEFVIEFVGNFSKLPVKQIQVISSGLGLQRPVFVTRIQTGLGVGERQRLSLKNVTGGYYRLAVTLNGTTEITETLAYDSTDIRIENAIVALTNVKPGDIYVRRDYLRPDESRAFMISYRTTLGNIPNIVPIHKGTLFCDPFALTPIPNPPYEYVVPYCDDAEVPGSLESGNILCKPSPSDNVVLPIEDCCTPEKTGDNVVDFISYEREIINPYTRLYGNTVTIRQVAAMRKVDLSKFNAYLRDFDTNNLTLINPTSTIENGLSIVFIEKTVDTQSGHKDVISHLKNSPEILPTRMTWK